MEFWFLKRVEKEAILNQGSKLYHHRLNRERVERELTDKRRDSIISSHDSIESGTNDDEQDHADDDRNHSDDDDRKPKTESSMHRHSASPTGESEEKSKKKPERMAFFLKEESDKSYLWGRNSSDPSDASSHPPKLSSGWHGVFRKYHQLERNWKEGNSAMKTLVSRRRVYCVLFSEAKQLLWSGNAKGTFQSIAWNGLPNLRRS